MEIINKKLQKHIWNVDIESFPKWKRAVFITARIFLSIVRDLADGQLSLRAMSLVYSTVISFVPLLAISFSVIKGFGEQNKIKPMILEALEPLGNKKFEITDRILEFVDNIQISILGAIGISLLIYSVISMMHKVEISFNFVWKVDKERTLSQRFSDYLSVLMLGPLMIFLSVGITTSIQADIFDEYITGISFLEAIVGIFGTAIPYLIMAAAFGFIYFYMPNRKVNIKSAFIGGLTTAVIWKTMGVIFSVFVASSSQQTAIYSAFASIIVFMVWIYLAWLVLLIGASISYYHQNSSQMNNNKKNVTIGNELKERMTLTIMYLIADTYKTQKEKYNFDKLTKELGIPSETLKEILDVLTDCKYIVKTTDKENSYYPARQLEDIYVQDILHNIRDHNSQPLTASKKNYNKIVDNFFNKSREESNKKFGKMTLKDLINQ